MLTEIWQLTYTLLLQRAELKLLLREEGLFLVSNLIPFPKILLRVQKGFLKRNNVSTGPLEY